MKTPQPTPQPAGDAAIAQAAFTGELEALMLRHGVAALSYTIDDDGIHAHRHDGNSWHLGWVQSDQETARAIQAGKGEVHHELIEAAWRICERHPHIASEYGLEAALAGSQPHVLPDLHNAYRTPATTEEGEQK